MDYVIIGASAAGINAARELRLLEPEANITIVSEDTRVYSRCILHHFINGERDYEGLDFSEDNFFTIYDITWLKGRVAASINIEEKRLILDDNSSIRYEKLLIASGASSFIPPVENLREAKNVVGLRNIEDAEKIREEAKKGDKVVVLGAGLVGFDAIIGLIDLGVSVSVVEIADRILPLQLDKKAAEAYESKLTEHGVALFTNERAKKVILDASGTVHGLELDSGISIDCSMIVVATGVRPNISFVDPEVIDVDRGIVIDEYCRTCVEDIYAAGDVTALTPIWPFAVKQGITAASNMAGVEKTLDDNFCFKNSMNFFGIPTVSIGNIDNSQGEFEEKIVLDRDRYAKILHKKGIIHGALFQGDISYCGVYLELIKKQVPVNVPDKDLFEIEYSDLFQEAVV